MLRRFICLVLALIFTLTLCGCKKKNEEAELPILKIGIQCNNSPFNWAQENADNGAVPIINIAAMYANGYDVYIALQLAESLSMKAEIYSYEYSPLLSEVEAGIIDIAISSLRPTNQLTEKLDITESYFSCLPVLVTKTSTDGLTQLSDLSGKKIAALSGTYMANALKGETKALAAEMADYSVMLSALNSGAVQGFIAEKQQAMRICMQNEGIKFTVLKDGFNTKADDTQIVMAAKKKSPYIKKANDFLATLTDEQLASLMENAISSLPEQKSIEH